MVAAQIIFLFVGRDYRVFGCPAFLGVRCGNFVLYPFFFDNCVYYCAHDRVGGSGSRLAFTCVYHFYGERSTTALYWNCWAVLV